MVLAYLLHGEFNAVSVRVPRPPAPLSKTAFHVEILNSKNIMKTEVQSKIISCVYSQVFNDAYMLVLLLVELHKSVGSLTCCS